MTFCFSSYLSKIILSGFSAFAIVRRFFLCSFHLLRITTTWQRLILWHYAQWCPKHTHSVSVVVFVIFNTLWQQMIQTEKGAEYFMYFQDCKQIILWVSYNFRSKFLNNFLSFYVWKTLDKCALFWAKSKQTQHWNIS